VAGGGLQSVDQQSGSWLTITFRGPRAKSDTSRIRSFMPGRSRCRHCAESAT
jgi:hypothetical protein